jgi:hypothetical protein
LEIIIDEDVDWPVNSEGKGTRTIQYPVEQTEEERDNIQSWNHAFMLTFSELRTSISDGGPKCCSASMR